MSSGAALYNAGPRGGVAAPDPAGTVEINRAEYVLGDAVEAHVSLTGFQPGAEGKVALAQARTATAVSGGGYYGGAAVPSIRTLDTEVVEVAAAEVCADAAGSVDERVPLRIPPRAAPSAGLEIQWHAVATFDVAREVFVSPAFKVLVPRETFLGLMPPLEDDSTALRLEASDRTARCGESLEGRLVFTPGKDTRVRDASVRFRAELTADDRVLVDQQVELAGEVDVSRGEPWEFPFSIAIPGHAPPTVWEYPEDRSLDEAQALVVWWLSGSVKAGRLLGKEEAETYIHVYNAP